MEPTRQDFHETLLARGKNPSPLDVSLIFRQGLNASNVRPLTASRVFPSSDIQRGWGTRFLSICISADLL